jgi:hypothetical protein
MAERCLIALIAFSLSSTFNPSLYLGEAIIGAYRKLLDQVKVLANSSSKGYIL